MLFLIPATTNHFMTFRILVTVLLAAVSITAGAQSQKKIFTTGNFKDLVIPSPKIENSFRRAFPDIQDEKWTMHNGYYFANFSKHGIKNQVVYTGNGQLDYLLKTYSRHHLPTKVSSAVKSVYYNYTITNAQELTLKNSTIYLVKIFDSETFKTIRVHNGDMEEIESYSTVISPCR